MTHLAPTPRVDKNGRTVIRHMRTSSTTANVSIPVPKPARNDDAISLNQLRENMIRLDWRNKAAIKAIDEACPTLDKTFESLLNREDAKGTQAIAAWFSSMVNAVSSSIEVRTNNPAYVGHSSAKEIVSSLSPHLALQEHLTCAWAIASVDFGARPDIGGFHITNGVNSLYSSMYLPNQRPSKKTLSTPEYWRGLVAITVIKELSPRNPDVEEATAFIEYAGAREDLPRIIDIARERGGTINVDTLEDIIQQEVSVPSAISDGLL